MRRRPPPLTREQRATRSLAAKEAAAAQRLKWRWYIEFNYKGPDVYNPSGNQGRGGWRKGCWPILFKTEEAGFAYIEAHPIFANAEAQADRPRIKSAALRKIVLR